MPLLLLGIAGIAALGYGADKVGEGINDASTGIVKVAIVGGVGFFIAKKQGWI